MKDENTDGASSFLDYVANAASFEAFRRNGPDSEVESLLSAESRPENASLGSFSAFAQDHPDKLFPLLQELRPEFQEIFLEYYILRKPQAFIAQTHGFIQTRCWQALRIIEQAVGALILLGFAPTEDTLREILTKAKQETTPYGSLAAMVHLYASSKSYAVVAKTFGAPVPAIRKIFRPAITALLADKNVKAVAVGAYLHNLTYRAALTKAGLSKSYQARMNRIKTRRFVAPPFENSALLSFGAATSLAETPWCMLELSAEATMSEIYPSFREHAKRRFGKHPVQIFAPVDANGDLTFGYFFARSDAVSIVRTITKLRGVSHISSAGSKTDASGADFFGHAVTVPHEDMQKMLAEYKAPMTNGLKLDDFVEILTGPASGYWGTVTCVHQHTITVQVQFPSERQFIVSAGKSAVKLADVPVNQRAFWGVVPETVGQ